jgi:hypothetical protein
VIPRCEPTDADSHIPQDAEMNRAKGNVEALKKKLGMPAYKLPMQQEMIKKQLSDAEAKLNKLLQAEVQHRP